MFRVSRDSVWIGYAGSITGARDCPLRAGRVLRRCRGPGRSHRYRSQGQTMGALIRLPDGRVEDEPQAPV